MNDSEIFVCKQCGKEHEALTQEITSYSCPNKLKGQANLKMLDSVSPNKLTGKLILSQTQEPQHTDENGARYASEKAEGYEEPRPRGNTRADDHQDDSASNGGESGQEPV